MAWKVTIFCATLFIPQIILASTTNPVNVDVTVFVPQCIDGIDNDSDKLTDYPTDPGCSDLSDNNEINALISKCSDTMDNDSDGKIDFPTDLGCDSLTDNDETSEIVPANGSPLFFLMSPNINRVIPVQQVNIVKSQLPKKSSPAIKAPVVLKKRECLTKGDLNNDCKVDLIDLSIASYWWGRSLRSKIIDTEKDKLNGDGKITLEDLSIIAYNWSK